MGFFSVCRVTALVSGYLCSAASALPVQFTYESNPINEAAFVTSLEAWELAYLREHAARTLDVFSGKRARVVLSVDCDISAGVYDCGQSGSGYQVVKIGGWENSHISGNVTVLATTGFSDAIWNFRFAVDDTGQVVDWNMYGSEFGGVGDFSLNGVTDSYGFSTFFRPDYLFAQEMGRSYCTLTHGVEFDRATHISTGVSRCLNGAETPEFIDRFVVNLGVGSWSMATMGQAQQGAVIATPLPAGAPLVLGWLAVLALLCRGRQLQAS